MSELKIEPLNIEPIGEGGLNIEPIEETTSLGEDFALGFANVGNTVDTAWSMLAGALGNTFEGKDAADDIYKNMEERNKARLEWANPKGKKQTFGGKVAGALNPLTLPAQIATSMLSPFQTGKTAVDAGETVPTAVAAQGVDSLGNFLGMAVPVGGPAFGPVQNTVLGGVANATQDAVTKDIINRKIMQTPEGKEAIKPTAEDAVVAGILGATMTGASQQWKTKPRTDFDAKLKDLANKKKAEAAPDSTVYVGKDKTATVGPSTRIEESPEMVALFKALAEEKTAKEKGTVFVDSKGNATKELPKQITEDPTITDAVRTAQQQVLHDRATELGKGTGETRDLFPEGEQGNLDLGAPYRDGMGGMGRSQRGAINLPDIKRAMEGVKNKTVEPFEYLKLWRGAFSDNELGQAIKSLTNPKSRDTVVLMSPDDFHALAAKRSEGELKADYTPRLRDSIKEGLKSREGLWEMPYLMVDGNNQIVSHEGRHRMDVFKEQGIDLVPVRLRSKEVPWSERKPPLTMFPQDAKNYSIEGKLASAIPAPSFIKGQDNFTWNKPQSNFTSFLDKATSLYSSLADQYPKIGTTLTSKSNPGVKLEVTGRPYQDQRGVWRIDGVLYNPVLEKFTDTSAPLGAWTQTDKLWRALEEIKNKPTVSGGMGRSQRGTIDPDLLTFGLASKLGKRLEKAKALEDSIGQKLFQEPTAPEDVVALALNEGKDGRGINNLEAGATLAAEKRGSALIKGVSRIVQRAKNIAENNIRTHVFPVEKSLRGLKLEGIEQLAKVMKEEMFLGQQFDMKELADLGLSEKQMLAYNNVRTMFDEALRAQNMAREAKGLDPISPQEAYLSSRWQGDFRRAVFDKKGNLVWYLADHTKSGLDKQMRALLNEFPDLQKGNSQDHTVRSLNNGTDIHSVYTTMLDVLGRDNPAVQDIKQWYETKVAAESEKAFAQTKHFENKSNIRGFVGDRPGKNPKAEAVDMFQQQIVYAKNAFKWAELQQAGEGLKTIFGDEKLQAQQPNNMKYAQDYFADQLGLGTNQVVRALEQQLKDVNVSPKTINDAVGSVKNLWITQKLAVSAGFMASNVIQAANVLPHLVDMQVKYGGNPLNILASIGFALPVGTAMATGHVLNTAAAVRKAFGTLPLPNEFLLKMMKYAEDNSVTARSIYDESPVANTFTATGKASTMLGKTISTPETFLRSITYLAYATQLKLSGKFKNDMDIFRLAEERTNISMGDYREGERALMFNKMGTVGNAVNVLQTFPINYYNQWGWAIRESMKGNVAPAITMFAVQALAAGAMGVPGFNDADKLVNVIKDYLAEAAPTVWNKVKDFDLKALAIDTFGESGLYGALSTKSGVAMTSRAAAPAGSEMLQNPAAPFTDLAEQAGNLGKALIDPTDSQKRAQAMLSSAPVGLQGYLETGPLRDETSVEAGDGSRIYKTKDLSDRQGSVKRDSYQETIRALGLRSQKEVFEKDAAYATRKKETQTQAVIRSLPDKFYNAVRKGDMESAKEYMTLYAQLSGNKMTEQMFRERILKEYTTAVDKASTKAKTVEGFIAVKRLRELLAEQGQ